MKKVIAVLICVALCLCLFGCSKQGTPHSDPSTTTTSTSSTTTTPTSSATTADILEYIKAMPTVEEVYSIFSEHQSNSSNGRKYEMVGTAEERKFSNGDFEKTFRYRCTVADSEQLTVEIVLNSLGVSNAAQYINITQKSVSSNLPLTTAKAIMEEMIGWVLKELPDTPSPSEIAKKFENYKKTETVGGNARISNGGTIVNGEVRVVCSSFFDLVSSAPNYRLLTYSVDIGPYFNNDTGENEAFDKWYYAVYPDQK